ncbi:hypothetical protein JW968_02695 [Candidatus Woesearchaeota archaeon]|nr:hypothetical protein [Candidatus Woesearchaeota archaeon]
MYKSGFVKRWEQRREEFRKELENLVLEDYETKLSRFSGEMDLEKAREALGKQAGFDEIRRYDQEAYVFQESLDAGLYPKAQRLHSMNAHTLRVQSSAREYISAIFSQTTSEFRKTKKEPLNIHKLESCYNQMQEIAGILGNEGRFSGELDTAEAGLKRVYRRIAANDPKKRKVRKMRRAAATLALIACLAGAGYAKKEHIQSWINPKISSYYLKQSKESAGLERKLELSYKALERDESPEALAFHNEAYERYMMKHGQKEGKPGMESMLNTLRAHKRAAEKPQPFSAIEHIIQGIYAQDTQAGMHHYSEAIKHDRHLLVPYFRMAKIYSDMDEKENMLRMMESAHRIAPDNMRICQEYGWSLFVNRQYFDAADALSGAVDDKSGADFHGALGTSLAYTGRAEQGMKHLQIAVDKDQKNAAWQTQLGALHYRQGDLARARTHLYIAYRNGGDQELIRIIEKIDSRLQEHKK